MKKTLILLLLLFPIFCYNQKPSKKKVKIVLMGTIHFEPSSVDMFKNKELDVFSEKKQKEIQEVIDQIVKLQPDQICIEYPMKDQSEMDRIYQAYLEGKYSPDKSETDQLALRAAKKMGLEKLTCVNYYGRFDSDTVMNYALQNGQESLVANVEEWGTSFMGEINSKLEKESIRDFLIYMNSKEILHKNASFYTGLLAKIGKGESYIGTDLVADWYSTNLHIYTNILRQIKASDEVIFVQFGQGHIPILKHLFETNSDFEVLDVAKVLGGSSSCPATGALESSLKPEIEQYLDSFMDIIRENSLYKETTDLETIAMNLKKKCMGAQKTADCYKAMDAALDQVDNHSFLMAASQVKKWEGSSSGEEKTTTAFPLATGHLLHEEYGYISMPYCNSGDSEKLVLYADELQKLIAKLDQGNPKAWVLDLRQNTGGNCWPMLAGIGPLLGEGICGYFLGGNEASSWYYKNGSSGINEEDITTLGRKPYQLKRKMPKVAVLTGSRTSSSGEVVTIAFRKRPNTKSFGSPTGGYSTGNANFPLADGAMLFLATSVYADRNKEAYGKKVVPDVVVEQTPEDDEVDKVLEAALKWLKKD